MIATADKGLQVLIDVPLESLTEKEDASTQAHSDFRFLQTYVVGRLHIFFLLNHQSCGHSGQVFERQFDFRCSFCLKQRLANTIIVKVLLCFLIKP